ncbi:GNAT family N-acetyltransferase [Thermoflavimicrobium dichotomicum]|uniref:Protein N-acetyltransferase, RimJ/RimL family n=1 Tax=Thermoflavimicrobium dichotomicum TaxID=46223 RepID=A0A1I3NF27_9BACL|nr:GNAT family protein [Thermoflavimicrobium dichotomicum]SFJ07727.1 Protein N-acetyltransferase, RimJ/RimL family [Thermoflavimicrobium dichotomicum]
MLNIRAVDIKDVDFIYYLRNDPEIAFWGSGKHGDTLLTRKEIEEIIINQRSTDRRRWFIIEVEDGYTEPHSIGMVTFRDFDRVARSVTIGMCLAKEYWGKGYGTQALRKFTDFLFQSYNLHRIQLDTFKGNERAIHTYKKCGFVQEGVLRQAFWTSNGYQDRVIIWAFV